MKALCAPGHSFGRRDSRTSSPAKTWVPHQGCRTSSGVAPGKNETNMMQQVLNMHETKNNKSCLGSGKHPPYPTKHWISRSAAGGIKNRFARPLETSRHVGTFQVRSFDGTTYLVSLLKETKAGKKEKRRTFNDLF